MRLDAFYQKKVQKVKKIFFDMLHSSHCRILFIYRMSPVFVYDTF